MDEAPMGKQHNEMQIATSLHGTPDGDPRLALRLNVRSKWMWVLVSADLHVVNRSHADFATRQECVADAHLNGFC
jgi:hypothetical protein